jgi:hypothetical protein
MDRDFPTLECNLGSGKRPQNIKLLPSMYMIYRAGVERQKCVVSFTPNFDSSTTWVLGNSLNRAYLMVYHVRSWKSQIGLLKTGG